MNQTLAVAVQAAKIKGDYLHAKYYYGVECTDCERSAELIHTHFLLTHKDACLEGACVDIPSFAESDIDSILNQSPTTINCAITISTVSTGSCSAITIEKL